MDVTITYDGRPLALSVPDGSQVDQYGPGHADRPVDLVSFRAVLEQSRGEVWLKERSPLIVVNDGYRSTPTPLVLNWLDGINPDLMDEAPFLVATGTHLPPTSAHLDKIFGSHLKRVIDRVEIHSAHDPECVTSIGYDHFGGEVYLNTTLLHAPRALFISSVEPHYFAGFTGGRKSLFPGLTDLATVERNHNLANSVEAQPMRLDGNPVAEHIEELTAMVGLSSFRSLQLVVDGDGAVASVHWGELQASFHEAVASARGCFGHQVARPYDLVIAEVAPPLDANLYQIQKALENCQAGVCDGGAIVLCSACREGIGSQHFYDLSKSWDREANQPIDGVLRFGSHKLSRVISHGRRIGVFVHSEAPPKAVRQVFYEPLDNLQEFLFISLRNSADKRIAVVHDAANTVLNI